MIALQTDAVVKVDISTGAMTLYNNWSAGLNPGVNAFRGGAFDGRSLWLAPWNANGVVRLDTSTGNMTLHALPTRLNRGVNGFIGVAFDGNSVWLVPFSADAVVK